MRPGRKGEPDLCALPGCGALIEQAAGRPKRLYCCAAHRATARRLRSRGVPNTLGPDADTRVTSTALDQHPVTQPFAWDDMEFGAGLPWPLVASGSTTEQGEPAARSESTQGHDVMLLDQPWLTADRLVEQPRPPRRRVVLHLPGKARSQPPSELADPHRRGVGELADGRRGVGGEVGPVGHRQRAAVVLATALVLLGGSAWAGTTSLRMEHRAGEPVAAAPDPAQWVQQAEGTLTLVSQQLDLIAQAEEAWNRQPAARRAGPQPPALAQLRATQTQLQLQRSVLQDQVAAVHALPDVQAQLVVLEQQLAEVGRQLDPKHAPGARSPEHAATASDLAEQRDMWLSQLGAKRAELQRLQAGVQEAVTKPLPTVPDLVAPTVESVLKLTDPNAPKDPGRSDRQAPVATAPRAESNRPKDEVAVAAPPNPVGPALGDTAKGLGEAAKDTTKAVTDTTESVADTTKSVADTGRGGGDSARSALPVGGSTSAADRATATRSAPAGTGSPMRYGLAQAARIADRYGMGDEVSSAAASALGSRFTSGAMAAAQSAVQSELADPESGSVNSADSSEAEERAAVN